MSEFNLIIGHGTASVFVTEQEMLNGIGKEIIFNDAIRKCLYHFKETQELDYTITTVEGTWNNFHLKLIKLKWT